MERFTVRLGIVVSVVIFGQVASAESCAKLVADQPQLVLRQEAADPLGLLGVLSANDRALTATDSPAPQAKSKDETEEYWKSLKLPFSLIETVVKTENCYRSQQSLLACVAAMNALLAHMEQRQVRLLPTERPGLKPFVGETFHKFGAAELVGLRAFNFKDPRTAIQLDKKIRAEVEKAWAAHLESGAKVDFAALFRWGRLAAITPENESVVVADVINGYISVLDAHGRIMPLALLKKEQTSNVSDSLVGIGVAVGIVGDEMTIQSVLDGGPAEMVGIRSGDVITHVEGLAVTAANAIDATKKMRGEIGTSVKITVRRDRRSLEFTVVRAAVQQKNVVWKLYEQNGRKTGYIRLGSFMSESAPDEIRQGVAELQAKGATGLVLDLRNNPGGSLQVAIKIAGIFLGPGHPTVTSRSLFPKAIPHQTFNSEGEMATKLPMVVLVNSRSASASELLSGALQDYQRAFVVGDRSFGKGTVQSGTRPFGPFEALAEHEVILFLTTARFHLPSGRTNQIVGITPDFKVYHSPNPKPSELYSPREEDIYSNALAGTGNPYVSPRPEVLAWISQCVEHTGTARASFVERRQTGMPLDYQLLYSADVLSCIQRALKAASRTVDTAMAVH